MKGVLFCSTGQHYIYWRCFSDFATETVNIAELLILERKTRCPFFLTKSLIPSENIVRGEEIMSLSLLWSCFIREEKGTQRYFAFSAIATMKLKSFFLSFEALLWFLKPFFDQWSMLRNSFGGKLLNNFYFYDTRNFIFWSAEGFWSGNFPNLATRIS